MCSGLRLVSGPERRPGFLWTDSIKGQVFRKAANGLTYSFHWAVNSRPDNTVQCRTGCLARPPPLLCSLPLCLPPLFPSLPPSLLCCRPLYSHWPRDYRATGHCVIRFFPYPVSVALATFLSV